MGSISKNIKQHKLNLLVLREKKMRIKLDGQKRRASGRNCGRGDMNKTHYMKISKN